MINIGIYFFTRDLSINSDFIKAYNKCDIIIPIFNFTPNQITEKNKYKSNKALVFMINSLLHLRDELKSKLDLDLLFLYDTYRNLFNSNFIDDIKELYETTEDKVEISFYISKDYTSYAKKRESYLIKSCIKAGITFNSFHNVCLLPPGTILTQSEETYKKFTPFYNNFIKNGVNLIKKEDLKFVKKQYNEHINKLSDEIKNIFLLYSDELKSIDDFYKIAKLSQEEILLYRKNIFIQAPYTTLNDIIIKLKNGNFKDYEKTRDYMEYSTTRLSCFLKFGLISVNELFFIIKEKYGIQHPLIRQLIWRDFYYNIGNSYDYVLNHNIENKSFNLDYDKIKWSDNQNELFKYWSTAQTGIPIVDASITELLETGYMHNRMRMLVASVLVKQFLVDWRLGEKFFAQHLIDYDPIINNLNWQFVASSGSFGFDYFRQLKPEAQNARFDKNCDYVKKWLPQLFEIPNKHIIQWEKYHNEHTNVYKAPIQLYDSNKFTNTYKKYVI